MGSRKTEKKKSAGGEHTTTEEAYIFAEGRALKGVTRHHPGQNFSKMFDITFKSPHTREKDEDRNDLYDECQLYEKELKLAEMRVKADLRENHSPGWKFFDLDGGLPDQAD